MKLRVSIENACFGKPRLFTSQVIEVRTHDKCVQFFFFFFNVDCCLSASRTGVCNLFFSCLFFCLSLLVFQPLSSFLHKEGKFLKKLWCCVGERVQQLS